VDVRTRRVFLVFPGGDDSVVGVLDAQSGDLLRTVTVGASAFGIAVDEQTDRVFVTNVKDGTVSVLQAHTGTVLRTIGLQLAGVAADPNGMAVEPRTRPGVRRRAVLAKCCVPKQQHVRGRIRMADSD
jgi:YVTN family beta-propeller protein